MSDIFNTVFQANANRMSRQIEAREQARIRAQTRQDQLNVATNNALATALARVNDYQRTLNDRELKLAQSMGRATGEATQGGTPGMEAFSRLGAAERQQSLKNFDMRANQQIGLQNMRAQQQLGLQGLRDQEAMRRAQLNLRGRAALQEDKQAFEMPFREQELGLRERSVSAQEMRARAARDGKLGTRINTGSSPVEDVKGMQEDIRDAQATLRNIDTVRQFDLAKYLTSTGKLQNWALTQGDKLSDWGGLDAAASALGMSKEEAQKFLVERRALTASIQEIFNKAKKDISGTAVSAQEMEQLEQNVLNKNLTPTQMRAELNRVEVLVSQALAEHARRGREGYDLEKIQRDAKQRIRRVQGINVPESVDLDAATEIRKQFKAGQISREEAMRQLKALEVPAQ